MRKWVHIDAKELIHHEHGYSNIEYNDNYLLINENGMVIAQVSSICDPQFQQQEWVALTGYPKFNINQITKDLLNDYEIDLFEKEKEIDISSSHIHGIVLVERFLKNKGTK